MCSVIGYRPTLGHFSCEGTIPISSHFDTIGFFSKKPSIIKDLVNVLNSNLSKDKRLKQNFRFKKLLIPKDYFSKINPNFQMNVRKALGKLASFFDSVQEFTLNPEEPNTWLNAMFPITLYDCWYFHKKWIEENNPSFGPMMKNTISFASNTSLSDKKKAMIQQSSIKKYLHDTIGENNILIIPTIHDAPPGISATDSELLEFGMKASEFTCIASIGGLPEITFPFFENKTGTINLSLISSPGSDLSLIALIEQFYSMS